MAPRANWKGYLKLSLVSCPIALYPATSASSKISFHRLEELPPHTRGDCLLEPRRFVHASGGER